MCGFLPWFGSVLSFLVLDDAICVVGECGTRILGELVSACERTSVEYEHAGELGKCAKEPERICRLILSNIRVI